MASRALRHHQSARRGPHPPQIGCDLGLSAAFLDRQRSHLHHADRARGLGAMEAELFSLGIATTHSRPYHPQTHGKVERFHQTLKKFSPSRSRPPPRNCSRASSTASPSTTTTNGRIAPRATPARSRPLERPGEGGPIGPADRRRRVSVRHDKVDRRRIGDAALQGQAPPHRGRLPLRRLAGHLAGRRPRRARPRPRRLAAAAPHLGPDVDYQRIP